MSGNPNPKGWGGIKVTMNEVTTEIQAVDGSWSYMLDSYTGKILSYTGPQAGEPFDSSSSSPQPE